MLFIVVVEDDDFALLDNVLDVFAYVYICGFRPGKQKMFAGDIDDFVALDRVHLIGLDVVAGRRR